MPRPVVANLALAAGGFTGLVQRHVHRQDQRAGQADFQAAGDRQAAGFELIDFFEQGLRGQHHTIAHVAGDMRVENARRNESQDGLLAIDDQGMPALWPP